MSTNFDPIIPSIGTHEALENEFLYDEVVRSPSYFSGFDMFFKPFTSEKEVLFNARHLALPFLFNLSNCLNPGVGIVIPMALTGAALYNFLSAAMEEDTVEKNMYLDMANIFWNELLQFFVDVAVFPLALLTFVTRGIATGVDAVVSLCTEEDVANEMNCI